jgi:hypothetical protein
MREASGGAEKLVAIEIRLTNSACNTETELTGLETLSTRCVNRSVVSRSLAYWSTLRMTDFAYALQPFMACNGYARVSTFQQPQQLRARNKKLSAQRTTGLQFAALDKTIDTEIIYSKQGCCFMNGIGKSLLLALGRLCFRRRVKCFHEFYRPEYRTPSRLRSHCGASCFRELSGYRTGPTSDMVLTTYVL